MQEAAFYSIAGLTKFITRLLKQINENHNKSNSDVKEHKLFQDITRHELLDIFNEYVKQNGFDVVAMTLGNKQKNGGEQMYNLILCKHISREDMNFVNRLMATS